jgi:hypothetical protein
MPAWGRFRSSQWGHFSLTFTIEGKPKDSYIVFNGGNAMTLACEKARELNEKEGKSALAA